MKKFSFFLHIMLAIVLYFPASAQISVNMANSGVTPGSPFTIMPASNCSFLFYDSGGPSGNYNLDADAHITFSHQIRQHIGYRLLLLHLAWRPIGMHYTFTMEQASSAIS